jgi:hypothetical protein
MKKLLLFSLILINTTSFLNAALLRQAAVKSARMAKSGIAGVRSVATSPNYFKKFGSRIATIQDLQNKPNLTLEEATELKQAQLDLMEKRQKTLKVSQENYTKQSLKINEKLKELRNQMKEKEKKCRTSYVRRSISTYLFFNDMFLWSLWFFSKHKIIPNKQVPATIMSYYEGERDNLENMRRDLWNLHLRRVDSKKFKGLLNPRIDF